MWYSHTDADIFYTVSFETQLLLKINWLWPKMNNLFFIKVQGLRQIFTLVVQSLQQQFLHTDLNLLSREDILALLSLVSLAEQILSWDFSLYHILSKN